MQYIAASRYNSKWNKYSYSKYNSFDLDIAFSLFFVDTEDKGSLYYTVSHHNKSKYILPSVCVTSYK